MSSINKATSKAQGNPMYTKIPRSTKLSFQYGLQKRINMKLNNHKFLQKQNRNSTPSPSPVPSFQKNPPSTNHSFNFIRGERKTQRISSNHLHLSISNKSNSVNNSHINVFTVNDSMFSNNNNNITRSAKKNKLVQRARTPNFLSKPPPKTSWNSRSSRASPNLVKNSKNSNDSLSRSSNIMNTSQRKPGNIKPHSPFKVNMSTKTVRKSNSFLPKNIFKKVNRTKSAIIEDNDHLDRSFLNKTTGMKISSVPIHKKTVSPLMQKHNPIIYQDKESTVSSESNYSKQFSNQKNINSITDGNVNMNINVNMNVGVSVNPELIQQSNNFVFSGVEKKVDQKPKPFLGKRIRCSHDISKTGMCGDEKKINQDNYFIFKNFNNSIDNIYMGVCDGHGMYGHEVSGFIKENLPMDLNHKIKSKKLDLNKDDLSKVIKETFDTQNKYLLRNKNIDSNLSGTTCVSVIYTPMKLIIANIGDSRAVLGKFKNGKWEAENLSRDHKPTLEDEAERIRKKGGRIHQMRDEDDNFVGPLRVYMKERDIPGLAMTRSFGDYYASTAGTISEPEITEHILKPEDKFLVLASDGLYEFIESDEVVNIIKDYYIKDDIVSCCEFLYKEASRRWIREEEDTIDDITIILVFFE